MRPRASIPWGCGAALARCRGCVRVGGRGRCARGTAQAKRPVRCGLARGAHGRGRSPRQGGLAPARRGRMGSGARRSPAAPQPNRRLRQHLARGNCRFSHRQRRRCAARSQGATGFLHATDAMKMPRVNARGRSRHGMPGRRLCRSSWHRPDRWSACCRSKSSMAQACGVRKCTRGEAMHAMPKQAGQRSAPPCREPGASGRLGQQASFRDLDCAGAASEALPAGQRDGTRFAAMFRAGLIGLWCAFP